MLFLARQELRQSVGRSALRCTMQYLLLGCCGDLSKYLSNESSEIHHDANVKLLKYVDCRTHCQRLTTTLDCVFIVNDTLVDLYNLTAVLNEQMLQFLPPFWGTTTLIRFPFFTAEEEKGERNEPKT